MLYTVDTGQAGSFFLNLKKKILFIFRSVKNFNEGQQEGFLSLHTLSTGW